ncbi:MAG: indole-3-glycerol phosphate synthase TrpC [Chitinophagales bacterium]
MNILTKILHHKQLEIQYAKKQRSIRELQSSPFFNRSSISMKHSIQNGSGIIAEIKRSSPSKGIINANVVVEEVAKGYTKAGASAISVLTDSEFFGGSNAILTSVRQEVLTPLLRKEFIIDEYQVIETKAIGADAILLIAAALEPNMLMVLAQLAQSIGLEVLMEVHNKAELDSHLNPYLDMVGVNNRNLKTFEVSVQTSKDLVNDIPNELVKISESGISNPQTVLELQKVGFQGFLIGEQFMKQVNPTDACSQFIQQIKIASISNH